MVRGDGMAVLATVGYGCLLALSALSFWSPLSLVPSAVSQEAPSFYFLVHFGLVASFAIAVLGHFGEVARLPRALFALTFCLLVIGFALSANSLGGAFALPTALLSSGALCTGLGAGFGLMCWMLVLARFPLCRAGSIMVAGSVFAAVPTLAIAFLQTVNPLSFSSLVLILLLLSLMFLVLALYGVGVLGGAEAEAKCAAEGEGGATGQLRFVVRCFGVALPCIAALALFQPLLDASGLSEGLSSFEKTLLSQSGNIVGALAVGALGRMADWKIDILRVFLLVMPAFVTVCLLFPFVSEAYWFIFSFVSMLLFSALSLVTMLGCLRFSRDCSVLLGLAYGVVGLCLYGPGLVGMAVGAVACRSVGSPKLALAAALLLLVAVCVALVAKMGRRLRPLRRAAERGGSGWLPLAAEGAADEAAVFGRVASFGEVAVADGEAIASGGAVSFGEIAVGADAPAAVPRGGVPARSLPAACAALSERFDLTHRESEILEMLAHGRNVPFIADALELSTHTVRGYVKSLYARLDVHSRQELIDLVEERLLFNNNPMSR